MTEPKAAEIPVQLRNPGLGVDAAGLPAIDPTANVIALVNAAIQRQDDLREMEREHIREILGIRFEYEAKLRAQEAERINALRLFDTAASARASEIAGIQASTLANQVAAAAEAMRNQVAATERAAATSLITALEPIQSSISDLRRLQYEQQGQRVAQTEVKLERREDRDTSHWLIGIVAAIGSALLVVFLTHYLK
jgi:hypothetical protein